MARYYWDQRSTFHSPHMWVHERWKRNHKRGKWSNTSEIKKELNFHSSGTRVPLISKWFIFNLAIVMMWACGELIINKEQRGKCQVKIKMTMFCQGGQSTLAAGSLLDPSCNLLCRNFASRPGCPRTVGPLDGHLRPMGWRDGSNQGWRWACVEDSTGGTRETPAGENRQINASCGPGTALGGFSTMILSSWY